MTQTIKVTDLPNAGVLSGAERVPIVQGVVTKQATTQQIANLFVGPGSGTVTSVGLSAPAIFSVTGSPITTSGTLALALADQSANRVLAGPSTGAAAAPTFRALVSDDLPIAAVPKGGTGLSSLTAYALLAGGTTSTGNVQQVSGAGTSGQILVSGGASALPSWQSASVALGQALTKADDTNVTLTLGGLPAAALLAATSITAGWTGQLAIARGGTGQATATAGFDALATVTSTAFGRSALTVANAAALATLAGVGTGDSPQFTAINLGHASDTTLTRLAAGRAAIEGREIAFSQVANVKSPQFGGVGDGSADDTGAIVAALATGLPVYLPKGSYKVTDRISTAQYARIFGDGRYLSQIVLGSSFNLSATSVIKLDDYSEISDIGFVCDQTAAANSGVRADLVAYPWIIDITGATHAKIERLLFQAAYNGINGVGNCGGGVINDIKAGCWNNAMTIDGALHTLRIDDWDHWVYGGSSGGLLTIWNDGTHFALDVGRVDDLKIGQMIAYYSRVRFENKGSGSAFGSISDLNLDQGFSRLSVSAGNLTVGLLQASGSDTNGQLSISGGDLFVSTAILKLGTGTGAKPAVEVTGGHLRMDTVQFELNGAGKQALTVSGGFANINGGHVQAVAGVTRTAAMFQQSGSGILRIKDVWPENKGAGNGAFVEIGANQAQHAIDGESANGWDLTLPSGALSGKYWSDVTTFTPSITFGTPGDLSVSYATQTGWYHRDGNFIDFYVEVSFTPTYTTASGNFAITGLGFTPSASMRIGVSEWSVVNLDASRTHLSATISSGSTSIGLIQSGDNIGNSFVTTTHLPTATAAIIKIAGRVRG